MSAPAAGFLRIPGNDPSSIAEDQKERRVDIDAKQARVAGFLQQVGCEGLLVLNPENVAWLTAGGCGLGILDPSSQPALLYNLEQRWLLCANVDSQRLFDEELDGLGFQLKEWPWHWGRTRLLTDLCQGRVLACDRTVGECKVVGESLRRMRRTLTPYEQTCLRSLGQVVAHAVEATCRTMTPEKTEREIAGQLSHRLLNYGVQPLALEVAADGRSRLYRRPRFGDTPVRRQCVLSATGSKFGLSASASRSLCFGPPDATLRQEYDAACKVTATYISGTRPSVAPREIFQIGRRIYQTSGFEHEWLCNPQGHITGRAPVELPLTPDTDELLQASWAIIWHATVGAACSCDTLLITDDGTELLTPSESWPLKCIRIQGEEYHRPYLMVR